MPPAKLDKTAATLAPGAEARIIAPPDPRIDQLGYAGELQKKYADDLKTQVKADMLGRGIERLFGRQFEGLLVTGSSTSIDPEKFLKLYESGRITRKQYLSALSVRKEPAKDAVSGDELARISSAAPTSPALYVTRIKGVEISLVDCLQQLAQHVGAKP